ncbi:NAD(P)/FAD-dependent oxidoreductase [Glaciihabitans arcticus]|uniref:NAD(P)/FAD-dependent oxidoreductase n=1 Tax=Glaciihabitans arcticus TaxID=2668039 RepID=A0A4Q9GXH0_9MICO|nr:NAD(P)/FAD-dependent oxidoreductase [Glaciihabitans arcticus]TBN56970.1 NAD(P)/FAD-dependent oxidoreductase [Glaciihabitans arcticus]
MNNFDVIIFGGGAAGLAAATALGRFRRSVLVIDGGQPRNAPADGVHNFLTRDGIDPRELQRIGREQAAEYGVQFLDAAVTAVRPGFSVDAGDTFTTPRLVLATGVTDDLPDIPGLADRWGRDAIHCPYCHGWEVRDRTIGILGTHTMVAHQAVMFRELSDDVTVYLDPAITLSADDAALFAARGIRVVHGAVASLDVRDDALTSITLADGSRHAVEALAVASRMSPRADMVAGLGLLPVEHPRGLGTHIPVDEFGATSVAGIWAAGNVSDPMAQVVTSAAQGLMVGAAVNSDIIAQHNATALARP